MNLYRRDPTLPDTPQEQADEQRLEEAYEDLKTLAEAERQLTIAQDAFEKASGETLEYLADAISDAKTEYLEKLASGLTEFDAYEAALLYYKDVQRAISSPENRLKEAAE